LVRLITIGILALNIMFFVTGTNQGRQHQTEKYSLLSSFVKVSTYTNGQAEHALVGINIKGINSVDKTIPARYNYDLLNDSDAAFVRNCFYNLDLVPDLIIDTDYDDYFMSALQANYIKWNPYWIG